MLENITNIIFTSDKYLIQRSYWEQFFSDIKRATTFPYDKVDNYEVAEGINRKSCFISYNVSKLNITRELEVCENVFAIVVSAIALLLKSYTSEEKIIIGVQATETGNEDLKNEDLKNEYVVLKLSIEAGQSFNGLLREVSYQLFEAYQNQDFPIGLFKKNVEDELCNIAVFRGNDMQEEKLLNTRFDLLFVANLNSKSLELKANYNARLYSDEYMKNVCRHVLDICVDMLRDDDKAIADYKVLPAMQSSDNLSNTVSVKQSNELSNVCQLFKETVSKYPDKPALVYRGKEVTYKELDRLSDGVASTLIAKGVTQDDIIAILLPSGIELIASIIGILKAGAVYLPVNYSFPEERIIYILNDCNAKLCISDKHLHNRVDWEKKWLLIDELGKHQWCNIPGNLTTEIAYIIYTSGTTGLPKGVCIKHSSIINYVTWFLEYAEVSSNDVSALISSLSFDLSYTLLYSVIAKGITLHLLPHDLIADTTKLTTYLKTHSISYLKITPSILNAICTAAVHNTISLLALRLVISGGEQLDVSTATKLKDLSPGTRLINHYGPTEATIGCLAKYVDVNNEDKKRSLSVGKPGNNINVRILDEHLNNVSESVVGELYVAGECLASGYLNNPELTNEYFIRKDEGVFYKTGDLATQYNGEVYIHGRKDEQVKIRGFRVDLSEIRRRLINYKGVTQAFVTGVKTVSSEYKLDAYVVTNANIDKGNLEIYLSKFLPDYMMPSNIFFVDSIPLTGNGKIDIDALSNKNKPTIAATMEFDETELTIKSIWENILGYENDGITSSNLNFFDAGGYSLNAITIVHKYHLAFDVKMSLVDFFEDATIKGHALYISFAKVQTGKKIPKAKVQDFYPVSHAQKQMFVLQELNKSSVAYNKPYIVELSGKCDVERIKNAIQDIINRHESLRTIFDIVNGNEIVQIINENVPLDLTVTSIKLDEISDKIKDFVRPFDLKESPLFRFELYITGVETHVLLIDIHHALSDGYSMVKLCEELINLYKGRKLSMPDIQYKDYAVWQKTEEYSILVKKQKEFWLAELRDVKRMCLQYDFERNTEDGLMSDVVKFAIGNTIIDKVKGIIERERITWFNFLLSVLNVLLHKITKEETIIVGSVVEGRTSPDLEDIHGVFVNTVIYKNDVKSSDVFRDLMHKVADKSVRVLDNQDYRFEQLVEDLNIKPEYGRMPVCDVFLLYNHYGNSHVGTVEDLNISYRAINNNDAKFDLQFIVGDIFYTQEIIIEYKINLFKKETALKIRDNFLALLALLADNVDSSIGTINVNN